MLPKYLEIEFFSSSLHLTRFVFPYGEAELNKKKLILLTYTIITNILQNYKKILIKDKIKFT